MNASSPPRTPENLLSHSWRRLHEWKWDCRVLVAFSDLTRLLNWRATKSTTKHQDTATPPSQDCSRIFKLTLVLSIEITGSNWEGCIRDPKVGKAVLSRHLQTIDGLLWFLLHLALRDLPRWCSWNPWSGEHRALAGSANCEDDFQGIQKLSPHFYQASCWHKTDLHGPRCHLSQAPMEPQFAQSQMDSESGNMNSHGQHTGDKACFVAEWPL